MNVVVTGHTSGIGKYFFDYYNQKGHAVGFSRSNGHDISNSTTQDHIIEACADADIFINNAYSTFSQTELLFKFAKSYLSSNKTIINIGSGITQKYERIPDVQYRTAKLSLDDACKEIWTDIDRQQLLLHVMLAIPCKIKTGRAIHNPLNLEPVSTQSFCDLVIHCLNINEYKVRQLGIGLSY